MSKRKKTVSGPSTSTGIETGGTITFTSRNPAWAYLHLELRHLKPWINSLIEKSRVSDSSTATPTANKHIAPLDALTARTYLTSALSQFLGVTGTAIPIDILKLDTETNGEAAAEPANPLQPGPAPSGIRGHPNAIWIRVPYADATAVVAAVSSWVGGDTGGDSKNRVAFRVRGRGGSLAALTAGDGADMFVP